MNSKVIGALGKFKKGGGVKSKKRPSSKSSYPLGSKFSVVAKQVFINPYFVTGQ